jgi:hypothetical protein
MGCDSLWQGPERETLFLTFQLDDANNQAYQAQN